LFGRWKPQLFVGPLPAVAVPKRRHQRESSPAGMNRTKLKYIDSEALRIKVGQAIVPADS
jgi:hypothetical protein